MTIEEGKAFLQRGRWLKARIAAKRDQSARWRQMAESITVAVKPAVSYSSLPSKKIEECACRIVDLQQEILAEIDALILIEREIKEAIAAAPMEESLKTLLEMRYLNAYTWEEIAACLCRTERWVMALHKKALAIFSESMLIHL